MISAADDDGGVGVLLHRAELADPSRYCDDPCWSSQTSSDGAEIIGGLGSGTRRHRVLVVRENVSQDHVQCWKCWIHPLIYQQGPSTRVTQMQVALSFSECISFLPGSSSTVKIWLFQAARSRVSFHLQIHSNRNCYDVRA